MRSGQLSVTILFFAAITIVLITGFVFLGTSFLQLSVRDLNKAQAFAIAEAGVEYYRWHLAHAPTDYQDGTGGAGPYVHTYYDKGGVAIGTFTLDITAPPAGSTVVTVRSTGKVNADSSVQKIIEVRLAIPSFAKYAWALDSDVNFGSAALVSGLLHSNKGIHFDGVAENLVTSYLKQYNDPDHSGGDEWAVHTHDAPIDALPPVALQPRTDVFKAGRQVEVPKVNFAQITQDMNDMREIASSSGYYFASSSASGYDLVFATSGQYSVYKVTALVPKGSCSSDGSADWGTWSIQTETLYATGTIPTNGVMFFEDHLWVRGQISGKRVTVVSGRLPDPITSRTSITVNTALRYTNYDGTDALALIAQNHVNVGLKSDDNLRIDGALIAQNGRVGRFSYPNSGCGSTRNRATLTTYGMLGTALRPAFYFGTNGYAARTYIYDSYLLYAPPPSFPLTTDQYVPISWNEIQ